jgi:DNA-binding transcriptional MerR regulator
MKKRVLLPLALFACGGFMIWTSAPSLLAETRVAMLAQANGASGEAAAEPMDHDERVELIQQIREQMKAAGLSTGIADELLKLENAVDEAEETEDVEPELRSLGRQVNEDLKSLASTIGSLDQSIRIPGMRYGRSGTAGTRYIDPDAKVVVDGKARKPPVAPAEDDSKQADGDLRDDD